MSQAILSVRLDSNDKRYFEDFCKSVGMNVSTAVNMFVKLVIRKQRLPFAVEADPFYSTENLDRLRRSIAEADAGHVIVHEPVEVS